MTTVRDSLKFISFWGIQNRNQHKTWQLESHFRIGYASENDDGVSEFMELTTTYKLDCRETKKPFICEMCPKRERGDIPRASHRAEDHRKKLHRF